MNKNKDKKNEKETVLFVDDEINIIDPLSRLLPCADYLGRFDFFVKKPKEGLVILRNVEVDIIIVDIELGIELNGIDIARIAATTHPDIDIVFFHGWGNINMKFEFPFREILKPVMTAEIIRTLYEISGTRRFLQKVA